MAVTGRKEPEKSKAERVQEWINRQGRFRARSSNCCRGLLACCQRELNFKIGSFGGIFVVALRGFLLCITASTPVWFKYFEHSMLPWPTAVAASCILFGVVVVEKIIGLIKQKRESRERAFRLAAQFGSRLSKLWPVFRSIPEGSKNDFVQQIEAMLALILDEAKVYLGEGVESDLAANLWLFADGHAKMKLAASTRPRPHVTIPATHMVAYYVAKTSNDYALHDYNQLKKEKIASHKADFRSIFYMSLDVMPPAVEKQCSLGLVTLTVREPFRFWPSRSYDSLRTVLSPHLSLLTLFLADRHEKGSLPIDDFTGG